MEDRQSIIARCWAFAEITDPNQRHEVAAWCTLGVDGVIKQNMERSTYCNAVLETGHWFLGLQTSIVHDSLTDRYYDWLFNRSWCAEHTIIRDVNHAKRYGYLLSGELPCNHIVAISTMYRTAREHRNRLGLMFDTFVDKYGFSEDLAFLAALSFHGSNWPSINTNHNAIAPVNPDYWHNFVNHKVVGRPKGRLVDSADYRGGVTSMWGDSHSVAYSTDFGPKLLKYVESKRGASDSVVVLNPFQPVVKTTETGYVSITDIEAAASEIKEKFDVVQDIRAVAAG